MHLPTVALALGLALVPCSARTTCAPVPCDAWLRETARWTGRFAVVVTGHVRTVTQQVPTLAALVAAHASEGCAGGRLLPSVGRPRARRVPRARALRVAPAREARDVRAARVLVELVRREVVPLPVAFSRPRGVRAARRRRARRRDVLPRARTRADALHAEPRALNFSALWSAHAAAPPRTSSCSPRTRARLGRRRRGHARAHAHARARARATRSRRRSRPALPRARRRGGARGALRRHRRRLHVPPPGAARRAHAAGGGRATDRARARAARGGRAGADAVLRAALHRALRRARAARNAQSCGLPRPAAVHSGWRGPPIGSCRTVPSF